MKTTKIDTRMRSDGLWQCWVVLSVVDLVVIGSGRTEYQAQYQAAQFMDTNYPDIVVDWIGGYHGGDTSKKSIVVPSDYWGE